MVVASVYSLIRLALYDVDARVVNERTQFTKYATFLNPDGVDMVSVVFVVFTGDCGMAVARDKVVQKNNAAASLLMMYIFKQVTRWLCTWTVPRGAARGARTRVVDEVAVLEIDVASRIMFRRKSRMSSCGRSQNLSRSCTQNSQQRRMQVTT